MMKDKVNWLGYLMKQDNLLKDSLQKKPRLHVSYNFVLNAKSSMYYVGKD